jgi:hypothetical protein
MHQRGLAAAAALPSDDGATPNDAAPTGEQQGEVATPEAPATEDSFTKLDPSTIPAELRPYYDSMQADYTRKTQEAAPYRKLAEETGLDVDGLRSSAELYSALQDPTQIVEFHKELTDALVAQGLSPAQAAQAATEHVTSTVAGGEEDLSLDPEERRVQELTARLDRFEQAQQAEQAQRQQEARANQMLAEMNRQEMVIKEQHPDWAQEEIDATYELSAFYGGNLIEAAARFDDLMSSRIAKVLNGKGAAASNPALAPPPVGTGATSRGMDFGDDLNAAHKAAMAAAKLLP